MRMTLITLFLTICSLCQAPTYTAFYIAKENGINTYDKLWRAICYVESRNDTRALNLKEMAVGIAQIRECRISHFNRLTGSNYTLNDCYDYALSKKVFLYFARGKSFEKASKDWNGSGRMTISYWEKVRRQL